jgi:hypothetical protein
MKNIQLRPPKQVMQLGRMGSRFQTRLSFMRQVLRRLQEEQWDIKQSQVNWDDDGYGTAVYRAKGPNCTYSLIAFTNYLDDEERSDRVIAEKWDATFTLFDGEPTPADIDRLRENVPKQEAGRCSVKELSMSRANKSVRLFEHVADSLAHGRQPDIDAIVETGYLMRTTAVYGNGKFGMSDRDRICDREEVVAPYQAEFLSVYLTRCFTHDLVEHVARQRNPNTFVPLDRDIRRYLGIGNSTGLGMAPFLYHHPILINNWIFAMEKALAVVRNIAQPDKSPKAEFKALIAQAATMTGEWNVADKRQMQRVLELRSDIDQLLELISTSNWIDDDYPWDRIYRWAEDNLSVEAQELIASLVIEVHPAEVDPFGSTMGTTDSMALQPAMSVSELKELIEYHYGWALEIDFNDPAETHFFWYASEEKLEPRIGERHKEPGDEREYLLTAARDVSALYTQIQSSDGNQSVAIFALNNPQHRHIVRRVQSLTQYRYAEIQANLLGSDLLPIDMLRFKLAFFGATKFDPKSDRWTRINLYQGAPLPDEIGEVNSDRWILLPCAPQKGGVK